MALLDPYVTREEYSAGANRAGAAGDDLLDEDLVAVSRLFDLELGLMPGAFNDGGTGQSITVDAEGGDTLWLRDSAHRAFYIRAVADDGIGLDTELDGTFDGYTADLDDTWVRGLPETAPLVGEPFSALQLLPLSARTFSAWPNGYSVVRLNCTLGWAEVPAAVKKAVESMTRDLRDHRGGGAAGTIQLMDESLPLADQTWRLILSIKRQYSRRIPAIA